MRVSLCVYSVCVSMRVCLCVYSVCVSMRVCLCIYSVCVSMRVCLCVYSVCVCADLADFRKVFAKARHIAIITGAGVSAESGVPTFRGEGGYWRKWQAHSHIKHTH